MSAACPEERIAQALNVNVKTIRAKRDLLNGICPEVAALLKDKHCPTNSIQALKKAKPLRQYEIAKTMVTVGDYTVAYARALVSASSPDQLVNPEKARKHRKVSPEEIDQIERELANLKGDVERIEETFAADHLNLVLATSYVRSLLRNAQITRTHGDVSREPSREVPDDLRGDGADSGGRRVRRVRRPAPNSRSIRHGGA